MIKIGNKSTAVICDIKIDVVIFASGDDFDMILYLTVTIGNEGDMKVNILLL